MNDSNKRGSIDHLEHSLGSDGSAVEGHEEDLVSLALDFMAHAAPAVRRRSGTKACDLEQLASAQRTHNQGWLTIQSADSESGPNATISPILDLKGRK